MGRWWTSVVFAIVVVVAVTGFAEAACEGSRVRLRLDAGEATAGQPIGARVDVSPPCDIVENGLLFGASPAELRYKEKASDAFAITTPGFYWIVAYVQDEDGITHTSAPHAVTVLPDLALVTGGHGSHGAPPFYLGTDADFLRQAGDPHYASLHRADIRTTALITEDFGPNAPFSATIDRVIGDTNGGVVFEQHTQGDSIGPFSGVPNPDSTNAALADLTTNFARFGHPRTGIFLVSCSSYAAQGQSQPTRCGGMANAYRNTDFTMGFGYYSAFGSDIDPFHSIVTDHQSRGRLSYFIPALGPGKRLVSAKLRASAIFRADASPAQLSGKSPAAIDATFCGFFDCFGWLTWDFTAEAAALAAGGGGDLELVPGPVPPIVNEVQFGNRRIYGSTARWSFSVNVNYPWRHRTADGSLTLVVETTCPRQLALSVTPNAVRPSLPGAVPAFLASYPTQATVEARVQTCPPSATQATVTVNFVVEPPATGSADAAGHVHNSRPSFAKGRLLRSGVIATRCEIVLDAAGAGSCQMDYVPSAAAGVERIRATSTGLPEATAQVTVGVPGLGNLAIGTNFFRLTGALPGLHVDNHWGTPGVVDRVQRLALDFFGDFGATLGINDMSLPRGGVFDICGRWDEAATCAQAPNGGHRLHRVGLSADIDRTACVDPLAEGRCNVRMNVPRAELRLLCQRWNGILLPEGTFHCEFQE